MLGIKLLDFAPAPINRFFPFFIQMAVYRVMIYPYLTLNPLHISLIIQFISHQRQMTTQKSKNSSNSNSNLSFTQQTLSYTFNHTLSSCVFHKSLLSQKRINYSRSSSQKNPNRVFLDYKNRNPNNVLLF